MGRIASIEEFPGFNSRERSHIGALSHRRDHLRKRMRESKTTLHFDASEALAIEWALDNIAPVDVEAES